MQNAEDLKARIRTRNLDTGNEPDIPLRQFSGTFSPLGYEAHLVPGRSGGADRIFAKMDFTDVEVHESVAPYEYDIATLDLPTGNREASQWGFFLRSLRVFLDPETGEPDDLAGHTVRFEYRKDMFGVHPENPDRGLGWWPLMVWNGKRGDQSDDVNRAYWVVTAVDGITSEQAASIPGSVLGKTVTPSAQAAEVDVDAQIIEALVGKTHRDGIAAATNLESVRSNPEQMSRVMGTVGDGIIPELIAAGKIVDNDGTIALA